jgi:hypothetical protein
MPTMSRPTLIVVADDLGLSPEVDAGILETVRAGTVTTADLFVNPPFAGAVEAVEAAGASVGVHLNLTHGGPCAPAATVPSLVGADGRFLGRREELLRRLDVDEARREWQAQFQRFREHVGHAPCHVSVHKHLHREDERLLALAAELARQCGVPLRTLNPSMREFCRARGVLTTDQFIGEVRPAPYWTLDRLREQLRTVGAGVTELMCHPGRGVKPIEHLWYLAERDTERETFCAAEARALLAGYRLAPCSADLFGRVA